MAQLIDTSVFIAMERLGRSPQDLVLEWRNEPVAMAAVTASELLVGVHRADSRARRLTREGFVESIIELFPVIPYDLSVARVHAEMWAERLGDWLHRYEHCLHRLVPRIRGSYRQHQRFQPRSGSRGPAARLVTTWQMPDRPNVFDESETPAVARSGQPVDTFLADDYTRQRPNKCVLKINGGGTGRFPFVYTIQSICQSI